MKQIPLLLAIDIGSTSIKLMFCQADGKTMLTAAAKTPVAAQTENPAELDVDAVWETIVKLLQNVRERIDLSGVQGIGVTSLLGIVLLDEAGAPIGPCTTWADRHARAEAEALVRQFGANEIYRLSGKMADAEAAACKLMRMKVRHPERFRRIRTVISLKDYIVMKLTGVTATDPIHASYTLLSDVRTGGWNEALIGELGFPASWFPTIRGCVEAVGCVTSEAASMTGLKEGTPVACGGPDGSVGCFGAGLVRTGTAVNVIGTTDVFFTMSDRYVEDAQMRFVVNPHVLAGKWLIGGPMGVTGGAVERLNQWFGARSESIGERVSGIAPGADGLFFLTSLTGERTPYWNARMRGMIAGLTMEHGPDHLYRAVLEGSTYPVKELVDILKQSGLSVSKIAAVGGGAKLSAWLQIRADIIGIPYVALVESESSSFGAGLIAGIAGGVLDENHLPAVREKKVYLPNAQLTELYEIAFRKYVRLRSCYASLLYWDLKE